MPLSVSGQVFDVRGEVFPAAKIEVWQTEHLGHYDLEGYRYRTTLVGNEPIFSTRAFAVPRQAHAAVSLKQYRRLQPAYELTPSGFRP
jgi:protocatechuate 3,4-dioxygenase beta subunit